MLHFGYILWCYSGHNAEKAKVISVLNPNIVHRNSFIGLNLLKLVHLVWVHCMSALKNSTPRSRLSSSPVRLRYWGSITSTGLRNWKLGLSCTYSLRMGDTGLLSSREGYWKEPVRRSQLRLQLLWVQHPLEWQYGSHELNKIHDKWHVPNDMYYILI